MTTDNRGHMSTIATALSESAAIVVRSPITSGRSPVPKGWFTRSATEQHLLVAGHHGLVGEARMGTFVGRLSQSLAETGVSTHPIEGGCAGLDIARRDQEARLAVDNRLGDPADPRPDAGDAEHRRFKVDQSKPFQVRREAEHVRCGKQVCDAVHAPEEAGTFAESVRPQLLQTLPFRAITANE